MGLNSGLSSQSLDNVRQGILAGIQMGARMREEQLQRAAERRNLEYQQQEIAKRQEEQFRQENYQAALRYMQQASETKAKNTIQFNKDYWDDSTKRYGDYLTGLEKYYDDVAKNPGKYDKQTVEGAQKTFNFVQEQRRVIAQATPRDFTAFRDFSPYNIEAPFKEAPRFSPQYQGKLDAQERRANQLGELADLTIKQKQKDLAKPDGAADKVLQSVMKHKFAFSGAVGQVYSAYQSYDAKIKEAADKLAVSNPAFTKLKPEEQTKKAEEYLKSSDAKGYGGLTNAIAKAKQNYAKVAPQYLYDVENVLPQINPNARPLAAIQQNLKPKYNNLTTFDDFHRYMNDLSKDDYSGPDGEAVRNHVQKYFQLMMDTPVEDPSVETDNTGEGGQ